MESSAESGRGFLTADALAAVLEEAAPSQQTHDLLGYLDEHGIEVSPAPSPSPSCTRTAPVGAHQHHTGDPLADRSAAHALDSAGVGEQQSDDEHVSASARGLEGSSAPTSI